MMPVTMAKEPDPFNGEVRVPGVRSVYEKCGQPVPPPYVRSAGNPFTRVQIRVLDAAGNKVTRDAATCDEVPGASFEPYWTKAIPWLLDAYGRVCAYSCFRIHPTATPTVDHMVPKSTAWDKVYEWSNYRLAALLLNSRKGALPNVIDPFEVKPGWFALELTFGQVVPGPATKGDAALFERVDATITELGLNDFADERLRDIEAYEEGGVSLGRLREESPFVASELVRQGRKPTGKP